MDHDQRLKEVLKLRFAEVFELFVPDLGRLLDFGSVEWLDKEVFPEPPDGPRRSLDLVARVRVKDPAAAFGDDPLHAGPGGDGRWLAVLHAELEGGSVAALFPRRMFEYFVALRGEFGLPVLPVAIYLHTGRGGVGRETWVERFGGVEVLRFEYVRIGLPAIDAEEALATGLPLAAALAGLLKSAPERRALLKATAGKRLLELPLTDWERFLLTECLETYLELEPGQEDEYRRLTEQGPFEEVAKMAVTTFERGVEKGKSLGIAEGRRESVRKLLNAKFGPVTAAVDSILRDMDGERLDELLLRILTARSLRDLDLAN